MQARTIRYLILATAILSLACGDTDRSAPPALAAETKNAATTPSLLSEARAMVEQRYAQHFAGGQGFSLDTLRGRRAWFTPRLYDLMLADMGHPEEGIGYIEADPFVDGQEDAKQFAVHAARQSHDTVFVDVDVTYPPDVGNGHETRRVTVAALPAAAGWQIADLRYAHGSLAEGLVEATRP